MIQPAKLEDLIRENIPFKALDSRGFHTLKCACCNDYKVRGGFKFKNGTIGYSCFNCGMACKYEEFTGSISKKMRGILNDFGIDDTDISSVVNTAFFAKPPEEKKITLSSLTKVDTSTSEVSFPPKSFRLGGTEEFAEYQVKLITYLIDRNIDINKYPFYFSLETRYNNRIIIPYYRDGRLIYWQARTILKDEPKRYDNCISTKRDAVMFNMDALNQYTNAPLFISEGAFDAMLVNGLGLVGSKLTEAKTILLGKSHRRLIFVIDKDRNGQHLAEDVLGLGYEITFSPEGSEDISDSVAKYGFIWTIQGLIKNTTKESDKARFMINQYCK
jgi:hypothetical protein